MSGANGGSHDDTASDTPVVQGLTTSVPLRGVSLFFADGGVHVARYGRFTPFSLLFGRHRSAAGQVRDAYASGGVDGLERVAEELSWLDDDHVGPVELAERRFTRPKLSVGRSEWSLRVHAPDDVRTVLEAVCERRDIAFESRRSVR